MTISENPKISFYLMVLTYAFGAAGIAIGFSTVSDDPPSLSAAALLGAGVPGVLSWLRHSVFNRSDAIRMGWDLGRRNPFQIEVGLANLAWGLLAILAVVLDWGIVAEGAAILVFGLYLALPSVMVAFSPAGDRGHRPGPTIAMALAGIFLAILGVQGITA